MSNQESAGTMPTTSGSTGGVWDDDNSIWNDEDWGRWPKWENEVSTRYYEPRYWLPWLGTSVPLIATLFILLLIMLASFAGANSHPVLAILTLVFGALGYLSYKANPQPSRAFIVTALALGLLLVVLYTAGYLGVFPQNILDNGEWLLIVALTSFFPVTYVTYKITRSDLHRKRLDYDLKLLGYPQNMAERELSRRYDPVYDSRNYVLHITLTILLTLVGLALLFWPPVVTSGEQSPLFKDVNTVQAMRYGFLGAYLFSVQFVYRRFSTLDLQPTVYQRCSLAMIAGLIFNYVAFEAISYLANSAEVQMATGVGAGLIAIVAFALGYFPTLAIDWFNRVAHDALNLDRRRADDFRLSLIDGLSQWHEARLHDMGVDNIQNLASIEILDLLVNTTFGSQEVIDWIDQALLYLYLDRTQIDIFRSKGIRTASDLKDLNKEGQQEAKKKLAEELGSNEDHLSRLISSVMSGPNSHYILSYWENAAKEINSRESRNIAGLLVQYVYHLEMVFRTAEIDRNPNVKNWAIQREQDLFQAYFMAAHKSPWDTALSVTARKGWEKLYPDTPIPEVSGDGKPGANASPTAQTAQSNGEERQPDGLVPEAD